jgi:hypothetical protein
VTSEAEGGTPLDMQHPYQQPRDVKTTIGLTKMLFSGTNKPPFHGLHGNCDEAWPTHGESSLFLKTR